MRTCFFICLFLFSTSSFAGLVLGVHGGKGKDNGKGIENFNGPVYGGRIGWRWNFFSVEVARSSYNLKAKQGQADDFYIEEAKGKGSVTDIMARFYLIRYLSFYAGITSLDMKFNIKLTNVNGNSGDSIEEDGSAYTSGSVVGADLHIPFGSGFELFGGYGLRKWSAIGSSLGLNSLPDVAIHEWHAGLLWHWDNGKRSRK